LPWLPAVFAQSSITLKKTNKQPAKNVRIGLGSACLCSDFKTLGVIQTNEDHFLIVKENKLTAYLAQIA